MKSGFYLLTLGFSLTSLVAVTMTPAFSQGEANQIINYENQMQAFEKSLADNLSAETTDMKVLNRLKMANSKKNAPLEGKILGRLRYEKQAIALDETNIHSLQSWVDYDRALEERERADANLAKYNANQDQINDEVRRRNTYVPPKYDDYGSGALWGTNAGWGGGGYGYGGYGGGGGWSYHGGSHMHYSSHGGGGGGHSSSHGGGVSRGGGGHR